MEPKRKSVSQVSHEDLYFEIMLIKENHLKHIHEDIDGIKQDIKEQRNFVQERLDRLDSRIWWIMGIAVTTLLGIIVDKLI